MAQDKEKLEQLLEKFLIGIINEPGNEWFVERLYKEIQKSKMIDLSVVNPISINQNSDTRLRRIEKYLGLDFQIDYSAGIIDYSKIKNEAVRNQLISDNREMLRYRLNCRSHKADFSEFCKFAHLQAEELLNYYYTTKLVLFSEIVNYIKKQNSLYAPTKQPKNIGEIPYATKLYAFQAEFSLDYDFVSVLNNIRQIRNSLSHRDGNENDKKSYWTNFYSDVILKENLPVKDKDFDTFEINKSTLHKNLFDAFKKKYKDKYDDYKLNLWKHRMPFDQVIDRLKLLSSKVQAIL